MQHIQIYYNFHQKCLKTQNYSEREIRGIDSTLLNCTTTLPKPQQEEKFGHGLARDFFCSGFAAIMIAVLNCRISWNSAGCRAFIVEISEQTERKKERERESTIDRRTVAERSAHWRLCLKVETRVLSLQPSKLLPLPPILDASEFRRKIKGCLVSKRERNKGRGEEQEPVCRCQRERRKGRYSLPPLSLHL